MVSRLALGLALGLAFSAPAGAVTVGAGSGSGMASQNVDIAITTGSLSGLGVVSYQFAITYNAAIVTAVDVIEAGSLTGTAGWGDATFNVTSGRIAVSHAGTTALSGSGTLVFVRFQISPTQLAGTSTTLTLGSFLFNEGTPTATTTNGTITVVATPVITVAPNSGEIAKTQTLQFTVSGGVTPPVTWSTTNPAVASISGTGLLTGLAPGSVRVTATDNAGRQDQTDSDVLIRGMGVTVGSVSALQGSTGSVNVTVTDLTGLGATSGQFDVTFSPGLVTPTGMSTTGTMLAGYTTTFGVTGSTITVSFAGSSSLAGAGTLFRLDFLASSTSSGSSGLTLTQALFNETLPAVRTNGNFTVTALPVIAVNPDVSTVLAGATRQFTLTGAATPPITWSTLNPAVASINSAGLLTGLSGGVTQVRAVDALGATDDNTSITVYDFQVTVPTVVASPGGSVQVPLIADRFVSGLDIRSLQYTLIHSASVVSAASVSGGLASVWGSPAVNALSDRVVVAAAGSQALGSGSQQLQTVLLTLSPSAVVGTNLPLTLSGFMANEGRPLALVVNGVLQVRTGAGVDAGPANELSLAGAPNPWRGSMRIDFTLPGGTSSRARVRLAVFGLDGRRIQTLVDRSLPAGRQAATWEGRDAQGHSVPPGVYFVRLEALGRTLERRVVRIE